MTDFKIYYQRLSDLTITATGTDAGYPLTNLKTYFSADQWRDSATSSPPRYLNIDVGAVAAVAGIDSCIIHNNNFQVIEDGGGAVSLEAADDSGYSTNLATVVADLVGGTGITVYEFSAVTKRYWRIKFATTIPEVAKLGQIFLTKKLPLVYRGGSHDYGYKDGDSMFETVEATALDGTRRGSQSFYGRRVAEYPFSLMTDAVAAQFKTFHDTVRGKLFPFYVANIDGTVRYMKLAEDENPVTRDMYDQNSIGTLRMVAQQADVY